MSDEKKPFHNPFAALAQLKASLPEGAPPRPEPPPGTDTPSRAVVRMERAGRGGKEVTVIEQLDLPERERRAWLQQLKAALGCGGSLEGGHLVVQGDHRERVATWLKKKGVARVSVG